MLSAEAGLEGLQQHALEQDKMKDIGAIAIFSIRYSAALVILYRRIQQAK